MSFFEAKMNPITIPSGTSVSALIPAHLVYDDAAAIVLYAPAALDALTYTIQVTNDEGATYQTLQEGTPAADVGPPAAGKALSYFGLPATRGFRLKSSGNVSADMTWGASKNVRVS